MFFVSISITEWINSCTIFKCFPWIWYIIYKFNKKLWINLPKISFKIASRFNVLVGIFVCVLADKLMNAFYICFSIQMFTITKINYLYGSSRAGKKDSKRNKLDKWKLVFMYALENWKFTMRKSWKHKSIRLANLPSHWQNTNIKNHHHFAGGVCRFFFHQKYKHF